MIEKIKTIHNNKEFCAVIVKNLSKVFDCICPDLLIVKLIAYGFDQSALKLTFDYLSGRSEKIKVGSSFSAYFDFIYGVPQESILASLLCNPIKPWLF